MLTRGGRRRESWLESHNLLSGVIRTQRRDANSNRVVGPSAKLLNGLQVKHQWQAGLQLLFRASLSQTKKRSTGQASFACKTGRQTESGGLLISENSYDLSSVRIMRPM
jgi:hypothetical protein